MTTKTTAGSETIDPKALRRCLGHFATGVAVVTTRHDEMDRGITVNSFTSLSLDPPLVLWCLARTSRSYPAFTESDHFIINVLAADQVTVSNRFAFREGEDFPADVPFSRAVADAPLLDGACAHFQCRKTDQFDGGDHLVMIGEVVEFAGSDRPGLVYDRGQYAVADSHPSAVAHSQGQPPEGFLDSTVRPGLERITQRFEGYFDNELRDAGVNSKEARVIGLLLARDRLDAEQIANLTLVSGSSLNETLGLLTTKDLIAQSQQHYSLTAAGRTLASALSEKLRSYRASALGPIAPAEAEELQRMLDRLSEWITVASSGKNQ
jgi:flavin reductase (DIM6/NTAB) family NADH-FMN oxidoreductase RutF/DNA-binding MarR family transcriptional regulator